MSYKDGITINGKHSYNDFGLYIASREIGLPEKKSIRKTVPFMNGFYDFTMLNGAPAWGEREIKYTFDIIGATVEEMDAERTDVVNWLCALHDVDIYDDSIPDYHFHGSYDSSSLSEDGEQVELTVVFVCYPMMIGNVPQVFSFGSEETASQIINNSGQPTRVIAETTGAAAVSSGGVNILIPAGTKGYKTPFVAGDITLDIEMKNEITMPYSTTTNPSTNNGVTYSRDDNGVITANGTATATSWFYFRGNSAQFKVPAGRHFVKALTEAGSSDTFRLNVLVYDSTGATKYFYDYGDGVWVTIPEDLDYVSVAIRISEGYTASDLTFDIKMFGELKLTAQKEVL